MAKNGREAFSQRLKSTTTSKNEREAFSQRLKNANENTKKETPAVKTPVSFDIINQSEKEKVLSAFNQVIEADRAYREKVLSAKLPSPSQVIGKFLGKDDTDTTEQDASKQDRYNEYLDEYRVKYGLKQAEQGLKLPEPNWNFKSQEKTFLENYKTPTVKEAVDDVFKRVQAEQQVINEYKSKEEYKRKYSHLARMSEEERNRYKLEETYYNNMGTPEAIRFTMRKYGLDPAEFNWKTIESVANGMGYKLVVTPNEMRFEPKTPDDASDLKERELDMLRTFEGQKASSKFAHEHPTLASIGTVVTAPVREAASLANVIGDTIDVATGEGINPYKQTRYATHTTNSIRRTVDKEYASKWFGGAEGNLGNYGSLLYNGLMSLGDMGDTALVAGGVGKLASLNPVKAQNIANWTTSTLLASDSANNTIIDAKERGLSDAKALALGYATGATEILTEKVSLDAILGNPSGVIKGVLKGFIAEGSEEMTAETLNTITDMIIAGNDSNFAQSIRRYINDGYSPEDAMNKTISDNIYAVLSAGVVGGFTGSALGGISGRTNKVNNKSGDAKPTFDNANENIDDINPTIDKTSDTASISSMPINVGKATTIKNPYNGVKPIYENGKPQYETIVMPDTHVESTRKIVENAVNKETGKIERSKIKQAFLEMFDNIGGKKEIGVKGLSINGEDYVVTVNKKAVGKVISDPNLSVEKLSVLNNLDEVVSNGEYLGSGNYVEKAGKKKLTVRFDYFETPVNINGKDYILAFDVEVFPNTNNYRTHKIINKMDLIPKSDADVGPVPTANDMKSSPSVNNIPQINGVVNNYDMQNTENDALENELNFARESALGIEENENDTSAELSSDRGVKFDLKRDNRGNTYWEIESDKDIFKGLTTKEELRDAAYKFLLGNRDNKVVLTDGNGNNIEFIRLSADEFAYGKRSQELYDLTNDNLNIYEKKMRMIPSLQDILLNTSVEWDAPDHKEHTMFKEQGFKNYRGKVRVDNVIFNTVIRVGKTSFGNIFYDINLEVDTILPHASGASEKSKNVSTSSNNVPQINGVVNNYDMQNIENDALENELNFARENSLGIEENENDSKKMKLAKRVMRALNERYGINFKIYSGSEDSFINGFYENGTVYINQNADKPMLSVIGHEFLHGFKDIDAEGFALLKSRTESDLSLKDYNRYKKDLLNDYKENGIDISGLSEPELNDKILEEAMSDLMGEMINDPETIRKIALEDKNLAERIMAYLGEFIDKIRSLFSENDAEIQSLVHNYEQLKAVYQEVVAQSDGRFDENTISNGNSATNLSTSSKNLANESNSISKHDVEAVKSIGYKSVNNFTSEDIQQAENFAIKYFQEMGVKSPFFRAWFGDWRANDNTPIKIATEKGRTRGITKNNDTGWDIQVSGKVFNETVKHNNTSANIGYHHLDNINSIVENSVLLDSYVFKESAKSPNSVMMHSLYALSDSGEGIELIKLYVDEIYNPNSESTIKRAYKLNGYNKIRLKAGSGLGINAYSTSNLTGNNYTVADLFALVKQNDKNFTPKNINLSMLEEDGTPKVFYHGTNAEFTEFDISKGRANMDIQGAFFSPWELDAKGYGANVGAYYLNLRNPASGEIAFSALNRFKGQDNAGVKAREYLIKQGFDGVNFYDEEYIAFYPNQIKSATDNVGTFDGGNPDTRFSLRKGSRAEKAQNAIAIYEDSGNVADLPPRSWAKEFDRSSRNTQKMLENQIATLEFEKRYAKTDEQKSRLDKVLEELRRKQEDNVANVRISGELIGKIEGSIERNYNLADIIDDLRDIDKGLKIKSGNYRFNDFYRNFERVFGKHFDKIKPLIDGFDEALGNEARYRVGKLTEEHSYIVKKLGIKKGSKESKAVQWIAEGERNPDVKNQSDIEALKKIGVTDIKNLDPNIRVPYTEAMLRSEFGERADAILQAEQWYRKQYDEMINAINETQCRIYPNRPEKLLPKRKDYMRHFREVKTGLGGLIELLQSNNEIAPGLVSVSEHTSPKEKWASIKQERKGKATSEGAIEGFNEYISQASYAIYINPYIEKFRGLARDLAELKSAGSAIGVNPEGKNILRIRDGMSDAERYNILVNKNIENVPKVNNEKLQLINSNSQTDVDKAYQLKGTDRKKLFVKIGEEFNVFKNYENEDIELSFEFTRKKMRESEQKQKGNYENFAKMFSVFDEVIERAVGVEVHNRNDEGYKPDPNLKEMYVLVSAFEDGDNIVPVKLEIKEFSNRENKLYVAVALESIKKNEVVKTGNTKNSVTDASRSFNISLAQLLRKINPSDTDFIKYIPKQFFNDDGIGISENANKPSTQIRQSDNPDLNGFIEYLNDFSNDLAGKTGGLDRAVIKSMGASGRTVIKALQWFNNRTKANAVLGNIASISKQIMNIPNGIAYLQNPANILTGIWKTFEGVAFYGTGWIEEHTEGTKVGKKIVEPIIDKYKDTKMGKRGLTIEDAYKKSSFLTSRYSDKAFSKFEKKSLNKGAAFMLGLFDELGTRSVWNALYYEAVKNDEADPIRYADVNTRKAVAGRGIGEIPLAYKSQLAKLALPFQIEPTNSWNVMRDMISGNTPKGKLPNFANIPFKTLVFFGVTCAMNAALEALTGSKGSFDLLGDILEGLNQGWEEEKDEDEEKFAFWKPNTYTLTGTKRAAQNVAGDFIGNRSFGWVVGELLDSIDEDWATNFFNDSLYQSQGVNIPALQSAAKMGKKIVERDGWGAVAEGVSSFALPFGGKQVDKTIRGVTDFARGGNYESNIYKEWSTGERGDMYYPIEQTPVNFAKSAVFGPSSLKANNDYWENKKLEGYKKDENKKLEEKETKDFIKAYKKENPDSEVVRLYNEIKRKEVFPFEPIKGTGSYTHNKVKREYTLTAEQSEHYQKVQNELMQKKYNEVFKSAEYKYADAEMKKILLKDARQEAKSEVKQKIKNDHLRRRGVFK